MYFPIYLFTLSFVIIVQFAKLWLRLCSNWLQIAHKCVEFYLLSIFTPTPPMGLKNQCVFYQLLIRTLICNHRTARKIVAPFLLQLAPNCSKMCRILSSINFHSNAIYGAEQSMCILPVTFSHSHL